MLKKNTSGYPNITPLRAGVWNKRVYVRVKDSDTDMASLSRVEEVTDGEKGAFETVVIGDILAGSKYKKIDILKIDVEGAEKEIFSKNYESWLGKVNVIMIELHDHIRGGCAKTFYSATDKFNFKKVLQKGNLVIVVREGADLSL